MQHKGLITVISIIFVISVMLALVAYGLKPVSHRTIVLDSFPSGVNVFLDGKDLGKTPIELNEEVLSKFGVEVRKFPLMRLFTHEYEALEFFPAKITKNEDKINFKAMKFSFISLPKSADIPKNFSAEIIEIPDNRDLGRIKTNALEAVLYFAKADKLIVIFDKSKMPKLGASVLENADFSVFVDSQANPEVAFSDYKSCRIRQKPDLKK